MPLTIKSGLMKYKDPDSGEYVGINAISDETTAEQIAEIQAAGAAQKTAVQNKGTEVINSIPADYTALSNEVSAQKSAIELIDGTSIVSFTNSKKIDTNGTSANLTPTSSTTLCCAVVDCQEGDKFTITGTGGGNARLWAFIKSNNDIISPRADANATMDGEVITAPSDADKLVVNCIMASEHIVITGETIISQLEKTSQDLNKKIKLNRESTEKKL